MLSYNLCKDSRQDTVQGTFVLQYFFPRRHRPLATGHTSPGTIGGVMDSDLACFCFFATFLSLSPFLFLPLHSPLLFEKTTLPIILSFWGGWEELGFQITLTNFVFGYICFFYLQNSRTSYPMIFESFPQSTPPPPAATLQTDGNINKTSII